MTEKGQQVKCQARLSKSKFLLQLSSLLSKDWVWWDHVPTRLARQATTYHFLSGPGNAELPALTRGGHSSGDHVNQLLVLTPSPLRRISSCWGKGGLVLDFNSVTWAQILVLMLLRHGKPLVSMWMPRSPISTEVGCERLKSS